MLKAVGPVDFIVIQGFFQPAGDAPVRKLDGSCLGSLPAPVAVDHVDFHVKECAASNAPGGGGPPNRASHRVSTLYSDLDE
jgi:hypothetical protein